MNVVPDVTVCEGCDAVFRAPRLRPREIAHCPRCGTELARHPGQQRERLLPLTLASLILFAIANLFPIVEIELQGRTSQTTLAGAVVVLAGEGMSPVALLVLATTLIFPRSCASCSTCRLRRGCGRPGRPMAMGRLGHRNAPRALPCW